MRLADLMPYVLPSAKGCPEITAEFAVRLAAIELCREALVWREFQAPVPTVALQTAYAWGTPAEQQVVKVLSATLGDVDIRVVDARIGRALDTRGETAPYLYGTLSGFDLHPAQPAGTPIVTYSVVAPSLTADTLPDGLGRYAEALARGALSRLLLTPRRDYTDLVLGAAMRSAWQEEDIGNAKTDAMKGFGRTTQRTTPQWF